nr:reverse transcriptase domain-containing protein [Tanacetum cinerariifolium]
MPPKRTSTSEAPAMTPTAIRQLVADSVIAALEAQAVNMANVDNTNRNPEPIEALVARKCSYKEFMSCQPFNFKGSEGAIGLIRLFERTKLVFFCSNCIEDCKVKFATSTLIEEALSWWNSFSQPIGIEEAYKISWELATLCPTMVSNSEKMMEAFIGGLPRSIEGNVTASKPQTLEEAINIAQRLMDQAPTEGYEDAIVVSAITADNFELKHGLLTLVQNKQFFGHNKEDPHAHVRYFNKITSTLKFLNVSNTSINLMLFPFSLEGATQIWLEKEPPRLIFTWDNLVLKFINQFFPPSKTTNLRNEITNFQQRFDESFSEACDRFKYLLKACTHHGFSELHQLDTFYNALNSKDQDSLNFVTGGNFLDKMPRECLAIIESKSKVRYSRNKPVVAKVSTNTSTSGISPDVAELKDMVKALLLDKKNQNQYPATVKAVKESYNIQEFVSQASVVNYNQGNTSYRPSMMSNQIRPPGFPPVPNHQNVQLNQRNNQNLFNKNQNRGNNFNQGPVYQPLVFQPPAYQAPAYQAPAPQTQGVSKEDFLVYVKANDAVMRNMQTQGQNMQNQLTNLIDLITKFVNSNCASTSSSGTLRSHTIANPRSDLKAITTRSEIIELSKGLTTLASSTIGFYTFFKMPEIINMSFPIVPKAREKWEACIFLIIKTESKSGVSLAGIGGLFPKLSLRSPVCMRTRSSSNIVGESSPNSTFSNPKHRNRRRSKQPFILEESYVDTMAGQRTMAELLRAPTEGYAEAIVVLPILAEHFELKHSLINMITSDQFFGLKKDNPHDHIRWFNKITSTIKYKDVPNSAIKLMLFPFSLAGAAHRWLEKESPRSILTWEDIDHYKDLLRACPRHGFTELHQLDTFYNALNPADHDSLNSATGGNLLERRTQDVLTIIENKSKIAKLTHAVNRQTSVVTTVMTAILKQFQATPPPASIKAAEEICVTCGGPLPSNTIANPKGELKAITTRSGLVLDGPFVLMPPPFINLEEDERVEETFTDQDLTEYTIKKILKALLSIKEKLLELANTPLNENCSAVILKKLPEKLGDPGKFLISCGFSELKCKALADLANRAICKPAGIAKDVFVPVGKFTFPTDFVIVDYESDPRVPLILGRHFLRTARALIDVHGEEMILQAINPLSGSATSSSLDHLLEEFTDELALITFPPRIDDLLFDIESDLREIEYLLNHDPIKEMDSILEDSVDECNLADPNNNLSKTDDVYNDPFDSKEDKIKESKLLIDELDPLRSSDFLPSPEYDSFLFEDFSEVDALPSTNNEDKVFNLGILIHENLSEVTIQVTPDKNVKKISISHASLILEDFDPLLYEIPFHKEVPGSKTLLLFLIRKYGKSFQTRDSHF